MNGNDKDSSKREFSFVKIFEDTFKENISINECNREELARKSEYQKGERSGRSYGVFVGIVVGVITTAITAAIYRSEGPRPLVIAAIVIGAIVFICIDVRRKSLAQAILVYLMIHPLLMFFKVQGSVSDWKLKHDDDLYPVLHPKDTYDYLKSRCSFKSETGKAGSRKKPETKPNSIMAEGKAWVPPISETEIERRLTSGSTGEDLHVPPSQQEPEQFKPDEARMSESCIWYYGLDNESTGPVTRSELIYLWTTGVIDDDTWVWQVGMTRWVAFRDAIPPRR